MAAMQPNAAVGSSGTGSFAVTPPDAMNDRLSHGVSARIRQFRKRRVNSSGVSNSRFDTALLPDHGSSGSFTTAAGSNTSTSKEKPSCCATRRMMHKNRQQQDA